MMSRWISFVPPPNVMTREERKNRSSRPASAAPGESPVMPDAGPTISLSAR
jgi:hypothetical protein